MLDIKEKTSVQFKVFKAIIIRNKFAVSALNSILAVVTPPLPKKWTKGKRKAKELKALEEENLVLWKSKVNWKVEKGRRYGEGGDLLDLISTHCGITTSEDGE